MNSQVRIRRSRGAVCGVALILLGLWGGLAPFVGPYFHFGFTPDKAWAYTTGRLYLSAVPGGAAVLGGLFMMVTRSRFLAVTGGLLGAVAGAWFVAGSGITPGAIARSLRTKKSTNGETATKKASRITSLDGPLGFLDGGSAADSSTASATASMARD